MLLTPTISRSAPTEPALDQRQLFAEGMDHVRRLARRRWTDHNVHDPGITILELLSYALTGIGYRAAFPIEDLLASPGDPEENAAAMARQFPSAGRILPNRPLTLLDYRKLLIDLPGVKNAWVMPAELTCYADPVRGELLRERPNLPGIREVEIRGLYRVRLDYMDAVGTPEAQEEVKALARRVLQANRNLGEDFVEVEGVATQDFVLCAELELAPDADTARVEAEILFRVERWLDPPVSNYSLAEMLERRRSDGSRFTVEEIFDGPLLAHGFLDDEEVEAAELRTVIRLSDVISAVMDIEGVRAVRDIVINPRGTSAPLADKWQVAVYPGGRPKLHRGGSRLVFYKRNMPVTAPPAVAAEHLARLEAEERRKLEEEVTGDLPIPLGRHRQPERYTSFQNDFPALYGLGEAGPPAGADERRRALARQLKGYLLFFDQVMANACAQLGHLPELFSTDPADHTCFSQLVTSFADWAEIYRADLAEADLAAAAEDTAAFHERRNRFLDHLVARYAERFHDYVAVMRSAFGASAASVIDVKCAFLRDYPALGAERGLAYDAGLTEPEALWNTANVSGLERRIGRLLGLTDLSRRDLGGGGDGAEGMLLIENLLLRPVERDDPFLPICTDLNCIDCADDDPYSYRLHVVLPAYAGRFANMDFRRFAEEVIREETPAHLLPKICWIDAEDMARLETAYREWLESRLPADAAEGADAAVRTEKLTRLIQVLTAVKNVYPAQKLHGCGSPEDQPKFILGRTALGSAESDPA